MFKTKFYILKLVVTMHGFRFVYIKKQNFTSSGVRVSVKRVFCRPHGFVYIMGLTPFLYAKKYAYPGG